MVHLLVKADPDSKSGITPFQAFATTVGSRVGMGSVAGVATGIYFGGPGDVFHPEEFGIDDPEGIWNKENKAGTEA